MSRSGEESGVEVISCGQEGWSGEEVCEVVRKGGQEKSKQWRS